MQLDLTPTFEVLKAALTTETLEKHPQLNTIIDSLVQIIIVMTNPAINFQDKANAMVGFSLKMVKTFDHATQL